MAKPGPASKPFELKAVEGNRGHRPLDITGVFRPEVGMPTVPKDLSVSARKGELETVERNASEALALHKLRRAGDLTSRAAALTEIQEYLGMDSAPLRIECVDISHVQGTDVVASLVRATSPACATLLAERLPVAITVDQYQSERP